MVHVEFPTSTYPRSPVTLYGLAGFEDLARQSRWVILDRQVEVTNAEFKRFLDQGGYQKQEYWKHKFRKDGRVLSWAEAMKLFRDKTKGQDPPRGFRVSTRAARTTIP